MSAGYSRRLKRVWAKTVERTASSLPAFQFRPPPTTWSSATSAHSNRSLPRTGIRLHHRGVQCRRGLSACRDGKGIANRTTHRQSSGALSSVFARFVPSWCATPRTCGEIHHEDTKLTKEQRNSVIRGIRVIRGALTNPESQTTNLESPSPSLMPRCPVCWSKDHVSDGNRRRLLLFSDLAGQAGFRSVDRRDRHGDS